MTKDEKRLNAFRNKLRKVMKRKGLMQRDVARLTNTDPAMVSRILSGADPRFTVAMRLLDLDKE